MAILNMTGVGVPMPAGVGDSQIGPGAGIMEGGAIGELLRQNQQQRVLGGSGLSNQQLSGALQGATSAQESYAEQKREATANEKYQQQEVGIQQQGLDIQRQEVKAQETGAFAGGIGSVAGSAAGALLSPTVLCTLSHQLGFISDAEFAATQAYAQGIDRTTYNGYRWWADSVVAFAQKHSTFAKLVIRPLVRLYVSGVVAHSLAGNCLIACGKFVCNALGFVKEAL